MLLHIFLRRTPQGTPLPQIHSEVGVQKKSEQKKEAGCILRSQIMVSEPVELPLRTEERVKFKKGRETTLGSHTKAIAVLKRRELWHTWGSFISLHVGNS